MPHALWFVGIAPAAAQLTGSAFNIWYNLSRVQPLLTPIQHTVFIYTVLIYNLLIYPIALTVWVQTVRSLGQSFQKLLQDQPIAIAQAIQARRRVINLPWLCVAIAGVSWFLCIPIFLISLHFAPGNLDPRVYLYLPVSILISALIAITHGFFATELSTQQLLYPIFFQGAKPSQTSGAFALNLRGRGLLLVISAAVCPIISLLLLSLVPYPSEPQTLWFAFSVGGLGIVFGLVSAWMVSWIVVQPVKALQNAAKSVATGDLAVQIDLKRADEFGPLIEQFNEMVIQLREKQFLQETFGRHVGRKAAQQILQRNPGLGGVEQELTVLFADLRNFTARCATCPPEQVVSMLNLFLTQMVTIVEDHDGMVNKFLGDGFMALFGAGRPSSDHAAMAVLAAQAMLSSLQGINQRLDLQDQPALAMGIGIHTGPAIVGSIGAPQRLEYTAIGDTVNIASRVETLTKTLGVPLLLTQATRNALPLNFSTQELPPQTVKGQPKPVIVYRLNA